MICFGPRIQNSKTLANKFSETSMCILKKMMTRKLQNLWENNVRTTWRCTIFVTIRISRPFLVCDVAVQWRNEFEIQIIAKIVHLQVVLILFSLQDTHSNATRITNLSSTSIKGSFVYLLKAFQAKLSFIERKPCAYPKI